MSAPDRRGLLKRDHESLSIRRQRQLLSVARSSIYRPPRLSNGEKFRADLARLVCDAP
jgi:putative transposase